MNLISEIRRKMYVSVSFRDGSGGAYELIHFVVVICYPVDHEKDVK